ncbi:MAG: hypothetical protein U0744_06475 [Gemmataceae bacterium]
MRLVMLFALAGTMVFGAYGVWKYAQQPSTCVARNDAKCGDGCVPASVSTDPSPNPADAIEPIVVMPEATTDEPFEPRVAGTTEESMIVDIPAVFTAPRFDGEGETKLRMPRADESFDWAAIHKRLEERSVLVFVDPLPVLPLPERIIERRSSVAVM